jgi:salicylate hydroxylase
MRKARILIAGGGIGGLTAALALSQRGFEVSVYEQAPGLHEFGAGIAITPNGSRVMTQLGMRPAIEEIASTPRHRAMRLFSTGQTWLLPASDKSDQPFWLVHRGDLRQTLADALEQRVPGAVHVGARCNGFDQDTEGVSLLLDNGERIRGHVLVGADGVHSRIRRELFGEGRATFTGFMAWRAVVPMERVPARLRQQVFTIWIGPSKQIVTYPMRQGTLLNLAGTVRRDDWLIESWSEAGTVEECRGDFPNWHEDIHAIIDVIDIPYKWALIGRPPLQHCSAGRVALLGDAFHPTLPILGQGANMAMEDSMILSRCLEASDTITEALQRYETARLDRTSRIVHSSFDRISRLGTDLSTPDQVKAFVDRQSASAIGAAYDWMHQYDAMNARI